jgi:FkbM family methyltransferase
MKSKVKILLWNFAWDGLIFLYLKLKSWLGKLAPLNISLVKNDLFKFGKVYELSDSVSGNDLYISRIKRFYKYKLGLENRFSILSEKYFLNSSTLGECDFFCDVGANIGEVSILAKRYNPDIPIIAIEPDPRESQVLRMNLPDIKHIGVFLDSIQESKLVTLQNDSGDTRLMNSLDYSNLNDKKIWQHRLFMEIVQTDTLDNVLRDISFSHGFLKLEAEGFEPEVLEGGLKHLEKFKYIAIDVTEERFEIDNFISSYEECYKILRRRSFLVVERTRDSALFKRI